MIENKKPSEMKCGFMSPWPVWIILTLSSVSCWSTEPKHKQRPSLPSPQEIAELPKDGGPHWNRLIFEKSPYLLQHAANPVDWYPWGEEAFLKARKENKPVFLSIGYATCHWCHVMERECFEDEQVAALLNRDYVAIKVDREERPDIDDVYMAACMAMTGSGGWPLTLLLTNDKKPFFAGTYFPKNQKFGRPGLMELLPQIKTAWLARHDEILDSAQKVTDALKGMKAGTPGDAPTRSTLDQAFRRLASTYDLENAGFKPAPKFPVPHRLRFLLRYWRRSGNAKALEMVEKTLSAMRSGGIYDHVGFGFHRYATDARWLVPHFEKMLYDQALLTLAYVEAYQATGKKIYADTAKEILSYVQRDLTSPEGAFYSAEDADSEGEEGKFYTWNMAQIETLLDKDSARLVAETYNLTAEGNFRDESSRKPTGLNIFHLRAEPTSLTAETKADPKAAQLEQARRRLFNAREKRIHPFKDDKVLTDWNGLAIAAFAKAARALDEPKYTRIAARAADFILARLKTKEGRLLKRYRQGDAGLPAHLEDYAYLVWGLLELYEAGFDSRYLDEAVKLTDLTIRYFWDEQRGGFFTTASDGEPLILRGKEIYDGALPSGNSVAALNLLRIGRITAWDTYDQMAQKIFTGFGTQINNAPASYCQLLIALDFALGPGYEVVMASAESPAELAPFTRELGRRFLPNLVLLHRSDVDTGGVPLSRLAPYTEHQKTLNGKATIYVCRNFVCKKPTTNWQEALAALNQAPPLQ